jgi:hypothetical protein
MVHLLASVRRAVADQNWYAALSMALTLPDICGKLEDPTKGSKARFVAWYNAHLKPKYAGPMVPPAPPALLSGEDCYALRCAYLHEGEMDVSAQAARDILDRFIFISPSADGSVFHNNLVRNPRTNQNILVLHVDRFCEDVCQAVEAWIVRVHGDVNILAQLGNLPLIRTRDEMFALIQP